MSTLCFTDAKELGRIWAHLWKNCGFGIQYSATLKLSCWFWTSHTLNPHHLSILQLHVTYENLLSIVFILPYNKLQGLMNTEQCWKYSTSFIFKGLDSLEWQDFFVENGTSAHLLGLSSPFSILPRSKRHCHLASLGEPEWSRCLAATSCLWTLLVWAINGGLSRSSGVLLFKLSSQGCDWLSNQLSCCTSLPANLSPSLFRSDEPEQ